MEIPRVSCAQLDRILEVAKPFERELSNRLQHEEPGADERLHETRLDDRAERLDCGIGNLLGAFERERPLEDRQSGEELLQLRRQQVVAPLDGRAERSLSRGA